MTQFQTIAIAALHESKTNPRRHFPEPAMAELAADIGRRGVLNALLVRPCPRHRTEADGAKAGERHAGCWEVICGARRYRAAKIAGLAEVPCHVQDMPDDEMLELQVVENLQREDVHPLDEAQGYRALLKAGRMDIAELAKRVGRSESYVHGRLKLCDLIEPAQQAFWNEKIGLGHALLLARLQPADQKRAMEEIGVGKAWQRSACDLQEWIHRAVLLDLKRAPFGPKETFSEQIPSCVECPKRSGAAPTLWAELSKDDRCTDPGCFDRKTALHIAAAMQKAKAEGEPLLQVCSNYLSPVETKKLDKQVLGNDAYRRLDIKADPCEHARKAIVVSGMEIGRFIVICPEKTCRHHWDRAGYKRDPSYAADAAKQREKKLLEQRQASGLLLFIADAADAADAHGADGTFRWRLVGQRVIERMEKESLKSACAAYGLEPKKEQYGQKNYRGPLIELVRSADPERVPRLVTELALRREYEPAKALAELALSRALDPRPLLAEIAAARAAELKAKADKKAARAAKAAKPRKTTLDAACVECGCTEEAACQGGCSWVPKADLPKGCKGPLCSACLGKLKTRASKAKPKPKAKPAAKKSRKAKAAA